MKKLKLFIQILIIGKMKDYYKMGFRTYFGKIEKKIINDIKDKNVAEIAAYLNNPDFESLSELYSITENVIEINFFEPEKLFTNCNKFHPSVLEDNDDTIWMLIDGENDFKKFIEWTRNGVTQHYKEMLNKVKTPNEKSSDNYGNTNLQDVESKLRDKISAWTHLCPYEINKNKDQLVSSFKREYSIFELVRLYKQFDFDKYYLVFMGY